MNKRTKNTLHIWNVLTAILVAGILLASSAISCLTFLSLDFRQYDNTVRLLISEQLGEIQKGIYQSGKYPYIVFDLSGRVLYAEAPFPYKTGEILFVQEALQYDKSFAGEYKDTVKESFVLQTNQTADRFAVFLVPEDLVYKNRSIEKVLPIFTPLFCGIAVSIGILAAKTIYCKKRIFKPIQEISSSAKAIIQGNYDLEVIRTYWKTADENEVGDLIYAFELMRDELKAKQIKEEMLKKSQQELISCISHDLKTPISTIKAYSEGLRDNIAKNPAQQAEFVDIIIRKTDLLIHMIEELLQYSNAQLNQLDIYRREVYLLGYLSPLMEEIRVFAEQNGFQFTYEPKMSDMIVCIDCKRITEVLYNLIENSMKYRSKTQGKIAVTAEYAEGYALIRVKDNGIGISPDDIPYVFDRFYRAEKSRSTSIPGSGLGLSICKYIINAHDGEIYCKSQPNRGCEIGFTLM